MSEIIKAVIYGIVEGITEWLPVSSTGHLILVSALIPFTASAGGIADVDAFFEMFEVVIQLGAILAVVLLFWKQIWPFALTKKERQGRTGAAAYLKKDIWILWFKILVSCVPAAVIGILFDDELDALFYNPVSVASALIVFGIAFIVIENLSDRAADRRVSGDRGGVSRHVPLRRDHRGRAADRGVQNGGRGIYVLSGDPGHVRGEPVKAVKVRVCLYRHGVSAFNGGNGGFLRGFRLRPQISFGVCQKA